MKKSNNIEVIFFDDVIAVKTGKKITRPIGFDEQYELIDEIYFYDLEGHYFLKNSNVLQADDEIEYLNRRGFHAYLGPSSPYIGHDSNLIHNDYSDFGIYLKENPNMINKIKVYNDNGVIIVKTDNLIKRSIGFKSKTEKISQVFYYNMEGNPLYSNCPLFMVDSVIDTVSLNQGLELVVGPASPYIDHDGNIKPFKQSDYVGLYVREKEKSKSLKK